MENKIVYDNENDFERLCHSFYNWALKFPNIEPKNVVYSKPNKLFRNKKYEKLEIPVANHVLKLYEYIFEYQFSIDEWLKDIEKYIFFIRFAEKCFMYQNSDNNNIYAEITKDGEKKIFYYKNKKYKVKVTFENTKIKNPAAGNLALSMIYGEESAVLKFTTIDIAREYGKMMTNTFRFITGEDIELEKSDEILINNVIREITRDILVSYEEIVKSCITFYTGIDIKNLDLGEIIRDGLWVRKR